MRRNLVGPGSRVRERRSRGKLPGPAADSLGTRLVGGIPEGDIQGTVAGGILGAGTDSPGVGSLEGGSQGTVGEGIAREVGIDQAGDIVQGAGIDQDMTSRSKRLGNERPEPDTG